MLDFEDVRRLLPQSYPMIMVDRVTEIVPDERIVAVKNVTGNESFFQGHFPGFAVMPAAFIVEGMAQATVILTRRSAELKNAAAPDDGSVYLFGSIHARLTRPVLPGDVLTYDVRLVKKYGEGAAAEGKASVAGQTCCEAELFFTKVRAADLKRRT